MVSPDVPAMQPLAEEVDRSGLGGQPRGLTPLFFTEMWERFSYYGMRALLVLFMTATAAEGGLGFNTSQSALIYGYYTMAVYMLSIFGGAVADRITGARYAVLIGGVIIAAGHFTMAMHSVNTFYAGLVFVAFGTGLLKPNISTMVGSLYSPTDSRRDSGFSIFYMGINVGGFAAPLLTGFLAQSDFFKGWLQRHGFDPSHSWHWAFALAGIGMTFGLVAYVRNWNRLKGIGLPPEISQAKRIQSLFFITAGLAALGALVWLCSQYPFIVWVLGIAITLAVVAYAFVGGIDGKRSAAIYILFLVAIVFFAIFEQAGSSVNLFARDNTGNTLFGFDFPSSWYQSINSVFVIVLAPVFAWLWLKMGPRQPSSPMKFFWGLIFLGLSFLLMVPAAHLSATGRVSPLWLVGLYFLQTAGELCLSPVGLSTVTKLAPVKLVGFMMGGWFFATSLGNFLSGYLARSFGEGSAGKLAEFFQSQSYFVFGAALLLLLSVPLVRRLMSGVH